ncbi:MAG: hypothetical protein GF388_01460 [Candidatus Aegiribacteria sp.]|nr:hypothetical protein [Candidatus Aegiribacteria sp.]MBD3294046.1 hypothetical protein [Candidatus Fermentibacteria bacterium]
MGLTGLLSILITLWVPATGRTTPLSHTPSDFSNDNASSGIPVLMYHHVSDPVNGYYGISTHRLRRDLELLDEAGFYLITPEDIENCLFQVPDDRIPLMLTFDDGWQDNFNFIDYGGDTEIDPSCAVSILEEYCRQNPDFGHGAVFFISWDKVPFGQEEYVQEKFNMLLDMGYVIGNHTDRHADFMRLPRSKWSDAVLLPMRKFHSRVGLRTGSISTLSYPGGRLPKDAGAEDVISGFHFMGRQAVRMGFLANGSVSSFQRLLDSSEGIYRIGRLDMSQYSVDKLLGWRNIMTDGSRRDLHDPLRYRMPYYLSE